MWYRYTEVAPIAEWELGRLHVGGDGRSRSQGLRVGFLEEEGSL